MSYCKTSYLLLKACKDRPQQGSSLHGQAHSIVKFLNNLLLLASVVHFNPIPVQVAEIDLLDPIRPESNGARCAFQVFVSDARLC